MAHMNRVKLESLDQRIESFVKAFDKYQSARDEVSCYVPIPATNPTEAIEELIRAYINDQVDLVNEDPVNKAKPELDVGYLPSPYEYFLLPDSTRGKVYTVEEGIRQAREIVSEEGLLSEMRKLAAEDGIEINSGYWVE